MAQRVALIAGAGGIIGSALLSTLGQAGWRVRALGRRPVEGVANITADLTDADATADALRDGAADTTHLFYAALLPKPALAEEAAINGRMLANLLDGLAAARAPLRRVVLYQGFKIYGIHLGARVRTPAREDDPPHMPPNLYQSQQSELRDRAAGAAWDYTLLRPDVVVGDVWGNPMNIALVTGVFAAISRALAIPLRFPGTEKAFNQLVQFTDAGLLARASAWAAESDAAHNETFNVTNGDTFRWERMWEDAALHLALQTAPPVPLTLADHMADKAPLWRDLARRHDLVEPDYGKLVGWGFGDFIFNTETDVISDVNKLHEAGFTERIRSSRSLLSAIDRLVAKRVLPPFD
jgi:nucleoside-diphosphate-sugar epimerase